MWDKPESPAVLYRGPRRPARHFPEVHWLQVEQALTFTCCGFRPGKGDHAVDEVSFDDGAADFAFAAWIRPGHLFGAILAQNFFLVEKAIQ
jgi:hypothetical protein